MSEIVLKGIPAAPLIAYGQSFILDKGEFIVPKRSISASEVDSEIARFEEAIHNSLREIHAVKDKITREMGLTHAQIFDAHLLVLQDATLIDGVISGIRENRLSAEYVFFTVIKKFVETFAKMSDEYLRERASDISDISKRVLKHLMDESKLHDLEGLHDDLIVVAHELSPSDAVSLYSKNIKGFLTDMGGRTSHTAIIAKSLGVPAVVGLKDVTLRVNNQDFVIIDGQKGLVIINPSPETKDLYMKAKNKITATLEQLEDIRDLPAQTTDGKKISMLANLELSSEIPVIRKYGAEGIGLYRTEFLYMNRLDLPSEDEQFKAYSQVVGAVAPFGVTIRTFDLGGDKFISSVQIPLDMTPFLGCRAIRFCLERPDIFQTQLRAILRASVHGRIQMMYPMISGIAELRQANAILEQVKTSLRDEKIPFDERMKVGVMIEVPSAVMTAESLARETDFFSIGTNDLIQYTLAVDRVNEKTAHLYEPAHPAVLKMIQKTIDAGHNENITVSLCGEMASDPLLAFLLLGMGIDELSMSAASILSVKRMIRSVKLQDAQRMAYDAMQLATGQEVEEFVDAYLRKSSVYC
jgi:phosphotransferase system enzyme I (PtsI)